MSTGGTVAAVALLVLATGGAAAAMFERVGPRAKHAATREAALRAQLDALRGEMRVVDDPGVAGVAARRAEAASAARQERELAETLLRLEAPSGGGRDDAETRFLEELAIRTGKHAAALRPLLPARDVEESEAAVQLATTRDLTLAATIAGVRDLVFVRYPPERDRDRASRFGELLPTRLAWMEYVAPYENHRAFVDGLLRRRQRGPFYTLDEISLEPVGPGAVRANVRLRRVLPAPGGGGR
ncbi:MAG TPA: hypothetical protein VKE69_01620 [Planctomycetota bacterium]|nr:hypothetical protein [Planctomycetota bacterium]